jgi:hypothetical protein
VGFHSQSVSVLIFTRWVEIELVLKQTHETLQMKSRVEVQSVTVVASKLEA